MAVSAVTRRVLVRQLFSERGWQRVTVDPSRDDTRALRFWRAVGFVYARDIESDGRAELLQITRGSDSMGQQGATTATETHRDRTHGAGSATP